ncbi:hypothetical protein [Mycolicibacterium thermoresistibile]
MGASVIAVNPATLPLPETHEQAVQLAALTDPLAEWANVFEGAREHLEWRATHFEQFTLPVIEGLLTNPVLFEEAFGLLTNPVAGLTTFVGNLPDYANTISAGLQESAAGLQQQLSALPETFEEISTKLGEGDFMGAFSAINSWAIFTLGYTVAWPLADTIGLPSTIAKDLGAITIGNVLGELMSQQSLIGYAYSTMSPPIVAAWVVSEAVGELGTALVDGDFETALNGLINLPAKVTNAFLNGQYVEYDGEGQVVPGLLSEDGPIGILFRDIPEKIRVAWEKSQEELGLTAATAQSDLAQAASTEITSTDAAVAVQVKSTAAQSGGTAEPSEPTPGAETVPAEDTAEDAAEQESTTEEAAETDAEKAVDESDGESVDESVDETDGAATDSAEAKAGVRTGGKESARTGGIGERLKRVVTNRGAGNGAATRGGADRGTSTGSRSDRGTAGGAQSGGAQSGGVQSGSRAGARSDSGGANAGKSGSASGKAGGSDSGSSSSSSSKSSSDD